MSTLASDLGASMNSNVVPPSNVYAEDGFCNTPFTNISKTEFKSINCERALFISFSKLRSWPLKNSGNLVLEPSCKFWIESIKSNSPNCHAENLSLKICVTSNSNSCKGADKWAAVTKPTGLNLSPSLNECPDLATENLEISKVVEPIPTVVEAALTSTSSNKLEPVAVVKPIPRLETPITGILS